MLRYVWFRKTGSTQLPRILLATIITTPRITIFIADLAADCFRDAPRKAPRKASRVIPKRIETGTEESCVSKTSGSSRAKDAIEEVPEVTNPDKSARRCTFDKRV